VCVCVFVSWTSSDACVCVCVCVGGWVGVRKCHGPLPTPLAPIYIYVYIHTYIHTYVYTYIHTYTNTHIHTYIQIGVGRGGKSSNIKNTINSNNGLGLGHHLLTQFQKLQVL